MAEMIDELKVMEAEFIAARCKLRQLQGKLGLFILNPHESNLDGHTNPSDFTAKHMKKLVDESLRKLDHYELQRDFYFENHANWERILHLRKSV